MGGKTGSQSQLQFDFSNIIKKAYETGLNDKAITVERLIEDLKIDLIKLKTN